MSSPLKDRKRKYQQKDQIGYIKEQVTQAQERILTQVKKVNSNQVVRKVSEAVTPKVEPRIPGNLSEEEEKLEQMRNDLIRQENALKLHQDMIRRQYTDHNLQKSLIASGYGKIKKVNKELSQKYEALRKNDSVVSFKILKNLGLFPNSGPLKSFASALFALHNSQQRSKRQALFDQIQASREFKVRLLNQLKIMDWQRRKFLEKVKVMKEERRALQRKIYRSRSVYDRALISHNKNVFMKFVSDRKLRNEYYTSTKLLWQKRGSKQDSSAELQILRDLDGKARAIRTSISLKIDFSSESIGSKNQKRGI